MNRASSWPLLLGAATFLAVALAFGNVLRRAQTSENMSFTAAPPLPIDKPALNLEFVKAAARGNVPRLKALLAQGADTNYVFRGIYDNFPDNNYDSATDGIIDGRSALSAASEQGNLNAVKFLVAHGAEVNRHDDNYYANDWTPIMDAVWGDERLGDPNRVPILKYLIEAGADVNATAQAVPHDETVLTIAAEGGIPEAVNLLIAAGAKPNAVTGNGDTALAEAEDAAILKALLAHGAIAHGRYGQEALWHEVGRDDVTGVRLLLDAGADVNSRDDEGQTPLMMACSRIYEESNIPPGPYPDIVELLLTHHASVQAKDKQGKTAMAHIKNNPFLPDLDPDGRKRDMAAIRLLKQAGARE